MLATQIMFLHPQIPCIFIDGKLSHWWRREERKNRREEEAEEAEQAEQAEQAEEAESAEEAEEAEGLFTRLSDIRWNSEICKTKYKRIFIGYCPNKSWFLKISIMNYWLICFFKYIIYKFCSEASLTAHSNLLFSNSLNYHNS